MSGEIKGSGRKWLDSTFHLPWSSYSEPLTVNCLCCKYSLDSFPFIVYTCAVDPTFAWELWVPLFRLPDVCCVSHAKVGSYHNFSLAHFFRSRICCCKYYFKNGQPNSSLYILWKKSWVFCMDFLVIIVSMCGYLLKINIPLFFRTLTFKSLTSFRFMDIIYKLH